jgi:hypothetical protein
MDVDGNTKMGVLQSEEAPLCMAEMTRCAIAHEHGRNDDRSWQEWAVTRAAEKETKRRERKMCNGPHMDKGMSRRAWLHGWTTMLSRMGDDVQMQGEELCDIAQIWLRARRVLSRLDVDERWKDKHGHA